MAITKANNINTIRHQKLRNAEKKAEILFEEIMARELIRPGITELELNTAIYKLSLEMFGIRKFWHKRIVRAGINTLCPYKENPENLRILENDIVFLDFGPVFEEWEADFGRTYVLGNDETKHQIRIDVEECWHLGKKHFDLNSDITGIELYAFIVGLASERSWEYPQIHCGHLIGNFPHEKIHGDEIEKYIHPNNLLCMRNVDKNNNIQDWILEIHFVDRKKQIGGFYEQLLSVD